MCVFIGETASTLLGAWEFVETSKPTLAAHALILGKKDFASDESLAIDDAAPKVSCNRLSSSTQCLKSFWVCFIVDSRI